MLPRLTSLIPKSNFRHLLITKTFSSDSSCTLNAEQFFVNLESKAAIKYNRLATGDLKKLILKCEKQSDLQYAKNGVELYQKRAQDFTSEICFHFIKVFTKLGDPCTAGKLIASKENRIGSWVTKKSTHNLLDSLSSVGELELMLDVVQSISDRGVLFDPLSAATILMKDAANKNDTLIYDKVADLCGQIVSEGEIISLRQQYPGPAEKAVQV